ncbi:tautomerase family protein [Yinghuangia sp. YIM S09857]|uniref:tautomerase family protein n=1 Tax=Yinghuangia sp. YIM S09857 TaxID=3436929 RepID=UPI003F52FF9F
MPFVEVKLYEERLTPETEQALVSGITEAVVAALGENARAQTWVLLSGTPAARWGIGGQRGEAR